VKQSDFDEMKSDLMAIETFLRAQGLPRLADRAVSTLRILLRPTVEEAIQKEFPDVKLP
jgi:hypothetical protein